MFCKHLFLDIRRSDISIFECFTLLRSIYCQKIEMTQKTQKGTVFRNKRVCDTTSTVRFILKKIHSKKFRHGHVDFLLNFKDFS